MWKRNKVPIIYLIKFKAANYVLYKINDKKYKENAGTCNNEDGVIILWNIVTFEPLTLRDMSLRTLWLWCSVLYVVRAQNDTSELACSGNFKDVNSGMTINITEWCKDKTCITKCCQSNQIIIKDKDIDTCADSRNLTRKYNILTNINDYSKIELYDKNIKTNIKKSNKQIKDLTKIYSDDFNTYTSTWGCIVMNMETIYPMPENQLYILEDGRLAIRSVNYYNQWDELPTHQFCIENQIVQDSNGNVTGTQLVIKMIFVALSENDSNHTQKNTLTAYGMLVSSVFLVLVLAVYASLPQLRNLAGLILMAYVVTLTTGFIFRAVHVLGTDSTSFNGAACMYISFVVYFSIIASFTWMNVMSFDIWWAMRGFRKVRQIHRRRILVKLGWYSLYGWGAPLMLVVFVVVVDILDLTHLPNFIKPHFTDQSQCFIGEDERNLYMNGPIFIATCLNIILFLMTAYNIWRIRRDVIQHSYGESKRNKRDETRFGIYLKLSLIMGINWILEVVSSLYHTNSEWWYIADVFNCLIGMFTFIIFVCKRSIIVLLCKRFSVGDKLVQKLQSVDSTGTGGQVME